MEWYRTTTDLLYGGICWTFIVCCIQCAAFRWFHLCHPYDQDPDFYYPARRYVCAYFLSQLLYLPFVLRPSEPHTLLYIRAAGLLVTATFLPLILNCYFRGRGKSRGKYERLCYVCPLVGIGVIGMVTLFRPDNVFLRSELVFMSVSGVVSVAECVLFMRVIIWLRHTIEHYQKAEYSNEADFPYRFAQKVLLLPWVVIVSDWLVFLTGSRPLLAVLWCLMSVFSVYFAILILHPQWKKECDVSVGTLAPEGAGLGTVVAAAEEDEAMSAAARKSGVAGVGLEVRERVIAVARRRYLEPHLTRRDIIGEFDYGERTEAGAAISAFGFYDMINTLRLEHARRYASAHPNETKESVAISSGFKDRFAMRHAAGKIGECAPEILEGFTPLGM